jgi:hypothetical protein
MQGKQLRTMALVLLGLGFVVLMLERPWASGRRGGGERLYPRFDPEKVERIEVLSAQDTVTLTKREKSWIIDNPARTLPADTANINKALQSVDKFKTDQKVSKNPAKFTVYEVDSTGASVKIFAGDESPAVDVIIGKSTPDGGTYFRPVDKQEVYASPDRIRSYFVRMERAWQDRRVFDIEPAEFSRLRYERGDSTIVFEKGPDGNWALKEPQSFPVTQEAVDPLLRGIAKLTANGFPDTMPATPSEAGFDRPKLKVRAERLDGSGIELIVGKQSWDGTYFAKPADRDWIYKIATYRVDPYYKNLLEMRAAPTTPPVPADTTAPAPQLP